MIHNTTIRDFVTTCFDKLCPDYFWTCPCSTTGEYHPQVSLGVGGLVRHTKLAVWWGIELSRALCTSPGLKDIPLLILQNEVIATLLLHDMIKNGKGLNAQGYPFEKGVTGTHGVALAFRINEIADLELSEATYQRIFSGIAGHMGIWTTDSAYKPTEAFAQLIHLADYCASRKVDEIYFILENEYDSTKNTTTTKEVVTKSPPCPGVRENFDVTSRAQDKNSK